MNAPWFSTFSAVSEIVVTILVLYVVITNLRDRPFRWKLLGVVLAFETCVNIVYMSKRAATVDTHMDITGTMKLLLAIHGIMALVMFVGLLLVYLLSTFEYKAGRRTWFQAHRTLTGFFIVTWLTVVGMGEYAYVQLYF